MRVPGATTRAGTLVPLPPGSCPSPGSSLLFLFLLPSTNISQVPVPHTELEEVCARACVWWRQREGPQGESETERALKQHRVCWGRPGRFPGACRRGRGPSERTGEDHPFSALLLWVWLVSVRLGIRCWCLPSIHFSFWPWHPGFALDTARGLSSKCQRLPCRKLGV